MINKRYTRNHNKNKNNNTNTNNNKNNSNNIRNNNTETPKFKRNENYNTNGISELINNTFNYYESELVFSFSSLCLFITNKCKNKQDYENFSQASLGRFKANYPKLNGILKNELEHELIIATFIGDFTKLLNTLNVEVIRGSIIKLASDLIKFNPNFGKKGLLSIYHTKCINEAINNAKTAFTSSSNEEDIFSDPFNVQTQQLTPSIDIIDETIIINEGTGEPVNTNTNIVNLDNLDDDSLYKKIRFAFRRMIRKDQNVKINKFHLDNKTVPKSLYAKSWPVPMLAHNENFMKNFNEIIFQKTVPLILQLNMNFESDSITALRSNIDEYKSKIKDKTNINEKINLIISEENKKAESYIKKSDDKAKATVLRQFITKPKLTSNNKNRPVNTATTSNATTSTVSNTTSGNENTTNTNSNTTNVTSNTSNTTANVSPNTTTNNTTNRLINNHSSKTNQSGSNKKLKFNKKQTKSNDFQSKHNNNYVKNKKNDNNSTEFDTEKLFTMFQSLINQLKPTLPINNTNQWRNNSRKNNYHYKHKKSNNEKNINKVINNNNNVNNDIIRNNTNKAINQYSYSNGTNQLQNANLISPLMNLNFDCYHQSNQLHQQQIQQQQLQHQQLQQQQIPQHQFNQQQVYLQQYQPQCQPFLLNGRTIY